MRWIWLTVGLILLLAVVFVYQRHQDNPSLPPINITPNDQLAISTMRDKNYPGSNITIEQTLSAGINYNRYIVSYQSDGLKIYGLLTVPQGKKPPGGWPIILLNHGYIPPPQYSTIDSYASFVDPLAQAGFIVFKPDYRGNGNSQGTPQQPYVSPDYVTDSMNALSSIARYPDGSLQKIGVLGHSMGGNVTLHELVITNKIKAAVILAGVVGDESQILDWWKQRIAAGTIHGNDAVTAVQVQQMIKDHGTPATNSEYWNLLDPLQTTGDITAPVQIQVGTADNEVPPSFSQSLRDNLQNRNKTVEFYEYPGADHNLAPDTSQALQRAIIFFNQYLK